MQNVYWNALGILSYKEVRKAELAQGYAYLQCGCNLGTALHLTKQTKKLGFSVEFEFQINSEQY